MRDITQIRSDLPALAALTYLNSGTAGPLPRASVDAMVEALEMDAVRGRVSSRRFSKIARTTDTARRAIADLVGTEPENVVLTCGTTDGLDRALSSIAWAAGDRIVTTDAEHPDAVHLLEHLRDEHAVDVVTVSHTAEPLLGKATLQGAVTPGVRAVLLSHISYSTGVILPVEDIVKQAHSVGAVVIVDGAQAVGALNVDTARIGADFYAFSGHKWLLGPEGTGALILGPRAHTTSAQRQERTSNLLLTGLLAALEWRTALGTESEVAAAIEHRAEQAREGLAGIPAVTVVTPHEHAGLVAFHIDGIDAESAATELGRHRIATRAVADGRSVRAAFSFFTTDEEIDSFVAAVTTMAAAERTAR